MKLEHKSLIFKAGDTVGNIAKALIIPHLFAVNRSQTTTAKSTEKKRKQNKRNQTCSNHKHREPTSKLLCLFSLSSHRLRGKYTVSCTFCKKYEAIPRTGPGLCFLRSFFCSTWDEIPLEATSPYPLHLLAGIHTAKGDLPKDVNSLMFPISNKVLNHPGNLNLVWIHWTLSIVFQGRFYFSKESICVWAITCRFPWCFVARLLWCSLCLCKILMRNYLRIWVSSWGWLFLG